MNGNEENDNALKGYLDAVDRLDFPPTRVRARGSRFWPAFVSLGLWAFAAWQVAVLPLWKPIMIRNQCELPQMARTFLLYVPDWAILAVGSLCTVLVAAAPWRIVRGALVSLAILAALLTYTANFFIHLKLNHICSMTQEERIRLGIEEPSR